jgi:hypothetical protein
MMRKVDMKAFCRLCGKEVKPSDFKDMNGIRNFVVTELCESCLESLQQDKPQEAKEAAQEADQEAAKEAAYYKRRGLHHPDCVCSKCTGNYYRHGGPGSM